MPGIVTEKGTKRASGVSSASRVAATVPVMPSPISVIRVSRSSSAYSVVSSPRNAIGISRDPSWSR